jgi:hypothetical protein
MPRAESAHLVREPCVAVDLKEVALVVVDYCAACCIAVIFHQPVFECGLPENDKKAELQV